MAGRLTKLDEWPRHQAGGTFDVVVDGSPHWSDGYYFTTGADDGTYTLMGGFRLYANNDVLDAFTCVVHAGVQRNMRWSRRLRPRIDDLDCGPIEIEIVEPLRIVRVTAGDNPYGITYDLTFEGVAPPYNEERVITIVNGRLQSDRSNYDQCCTVRGWLAVDGDRVDVAGWTGVRDHSWGIGNNVGGPRSTAIAPPPDAAPPIGLRQWCVFRLPERAVFWQFHHSAAGAYTKFEACCSYPYDDTREPFRYTGVRHEVGWVCEDGRALRRLARGTVELDRPDGGTDRFVVEPVSGPIYLQGGGYWAGFDDGLGRGVYRGDLHHEGDRWDVSHPTRVVGPKGLRLRDDHWAEAWARCTDLSDGTAGTGHLECVVIGEYPGFEGGGG